MARPLDLDLRERVVGAPLQRPSASALPLSSSGRSGCRTIMATHVAERAAGFSLIHTRDSTDRATGAHYRLLNYEQYLFATGT